MSFASKYNKSSFNFGVDTKDFKSCKVRELKEGEVNTLLGVFVRDGKFGKTPNFIIDGWVVYGTESMLETVQEILADQEACEEIKAGKVGIRMRTYENSFGKQYTIDYVDI